MNALGRTTAVSAVVLALLPVAASAQPRHHHRHIARAPVVAPYGGYGSPYIVYAPAPYYGYYGAAAGIVAAATERARHEPGVTLELEPDAKLTATGGPSGGIPDRSGGP